MNSFTVKFCPGSLNLGVIITPLESNQKFKVEMVTGEPEPVILTRSAKKWLVENPGDWAISDKDFQKLGQIIDKHVDE